MDSHRERRRGRELLEDRLKGFLEQWSSRLTIVLDEVEHQEGEASTTARVTGSGDALEEQSETGVELLVGGQEVTG